VTIYRKIGGIEAIEEAAQAALPLGNRSYFNAERICSNETQNEVDPERVQRYWADLPAMIGKD
jgi:hypothetical protein